MHLTNKLLETCGPIPPFATWDGFFSNDELEKIIEFCNTQGNLDKAQIQDNLVDDTIRKSEVKFINVNNDTVGLFPRFNHMVSFINNEFFRFNLTGFDHFQYTVYNGDENDHYDFHMDMNLYSDKTTVFPWSRKLSFSIVLSEPEEYNGGEFAIKLGVSDPLIVEQKKGRIIAFPSYIIHKVAPVTRGTRKSIVIWAVGPRFV